MLSNFLYFSAFRHIGIPISALSFPCSCTLRAPSFPGPPVSSPPPLPYLNGTLLKKGKGMTLQFEMEHVLPHATEKQDKG